MISEHLLQHNNEYDRLPPSLHIEGLLCRRRLWLKIHHFGMYNERQWKDEVYTLKNHLDEAFQHDWRFELRLPSGMRMDAWIPDEQVCIEFKSARPHVTHVYQVWMMMLELKRLKVADVEFQLWYTKQWKEDAFELAGTLDFNYGINEAGLAAMAVEPPDESFKQKYEREQAILKADTEQDRIPPVKKQDKSVCRNCLYFEFCHV